MTNISLDKDPLSNKYLVDHPYFKGARDVLRSCYDSFGKTPDPRCVPILGPSGCGKSTAIDKFLKELHVESSESSQRPVLVVETPSNPTVKTLASAVLNTIGDPLYSRGTEIQMTVRILGLLANLGTRLLVFDEMQNLIDRDSDKLNYKASDWLKSLINKSNIPTVIVGLERTEELFLVNEQLRRRFREAYVMKPFGWNNPDSNKNLIGFLKVLQQKLPFSSDMMLYSEEMAYRFYCATAGLVGYIMAIIREAENLARESGSTFINKDHLAKAYASSVCGNHLVNVNPFEKSEIREIEVALQVVKTSKPISRKRM